MILYASRTRVIAVVIFLCLFGVSFTVYTQDSGKENMVTEKSGSFEEGTIASDSYSDQDDEEGVIEFEDIGEGQSFEELFDEPARENIHEPQQRKAKNVSNEVLSLGEIQENEIVRRREKELEADQLYVEGRKAFVENDFEIAVRKFISAQIKLGEASRSEPRILEKQKLLDKVLAYTYEEWAEKISNDAKVLVELDKFEEAIEKYQKVIEKDPERKKEITKKIQNLQTSIKFAEFKDKTSPKNVDPEKPIRDHDIDIKLEQGKVYFENKRYADARELFEHVLLKEPYNIVATRYLHRINEKLLESGKERRDVMTMERIAEIKWKWNDPVTPLVSPDVVIEGAKPVKKIGRIGEGIWAKLDNIIIPKISFEEATIQSVVKYLKTRSRELDPDGEGVNIFLQLEKFEPEAEIEEEEEFGEDEFDFEFDDYEDDFEEEVGEVEPEPAEQELTISMDFDNIPLGEAVRYICQGSGLKYKVETHAVIIASQNVAFDEMETRFYPIEAGFLMQRVTREVGEGFSESLSGGEDEEAEDPLTLFQSYGVEFPQGAKITYDQRTSKLIVTNTPTNLRKVERILAELNVQPVQVTIEAKFVEIAQKDLEELGFEWLFTGDAKTNGNKTVDFVGDSEFEIIKQSAGGENVPDLSGGLRFLSTPGEINDRVLAVNSVLGSWTFNTVIRALQQKESTDVLSAPKVTTVSGKTAVLKVINERFFPESYTEPEFEGAAVASSGDAVPPSFTPSTPEFGDATEIGVVLTVTPTVAADGYSIDLELAPEVVQFLGFDDFGYTVKLGEDEFEVPVDVPIISKRQIRTKVIVWDGETVVLGGMITEDIREIDDKIPVLGELPVVGRLFRTKGETSDKRNLLIFVTARLVNPAGLPVRTADIRGLPDFRR